MPSSFHEALVLLFQNRPELAAELLRDALGVELPTYTAVRIESAEFSDIKPASRHADVVVLLVAERPVQGIIVEVQLGTDSDKPFAWPMYVANLRYRFHCPVDVLVVTPDSKLATWAARPVAVGQRSSFSAFVIGPEGVPVIESLEHAEQAPELAVLSAVAHGKGPVDDAVRLADFAARASFHGSAKHFAVYYDLILAGLSEAARKAFDMLPQGYEYQDKSLKRSFSDGRAQALLDVLESRQLAISDEQRQRIIECNDVETLRAWTRKAITVSSVDELFSKGE